MPAKTLSLMLSASKKYDWQCAACVNVQQEELDQCNVNIDEPRQIRPRRTNELVLRETVIKFGSRKRKQDSDFNSNSNNNKNDNEKETIKNKKTKSSKDESIIKSKRTSSKIDSSSSSSSKEVIDTKPDGEKSTTSKSRTSVIKQLFTRKTADFIPESLPKRTSSAARK
ncbi:unnamed protein product, partial [Rotaria socialis]